MNIMDDRHATAESITPEIFQRTKRNVEQQPKPTPIQRVHQAALAELTTPDEWQALADTFASRALYLRTHPHQ